MQIDKRGLGIESQPLLAELEAANNQLIGAIKTTHSAQLDISASDPVRERLDLLLDNCVGTAPVSQADLDSLVANGEERYKEKIPPGFADADKNKNPNEASFIFDHIKYQRKFGDLILWRQLIQHAKNVNIKAVLLITADRKEDWWWREQGKIIGPHPELVREIQREGGVELFWMYSSVQFVEHANKYASAKVSKESVAEIKQVALSSSTSSANLRDLLGRAHLTFLSNQGADLSEHSFSSRMDYRIADSSVELWLKRHGELVESNPRGFPDFLVKNDDDVHGYEVKYLRQFDRMQIPPGIVNEMLRGYMEIIEGRLSGFSLIIVIPEKDFFNILNTERDVQLHRRLGRLISRHPINSIIVGAVVEGDFMVLIQQQEPASDQDGFF